jgi:flagellar biosynthesis/type III secretory pathway protein FliH
LSRLLAAPGVDAQPRPLGQPDPALDAAARAAIEQAVEAAYQRGRREGAADAAAAAEQAAARVLAGVQRSEAELRAVAASADVELALAIATAVLDREPGDDGVRLLARIEQALAALDDERVVVHLNTADVTALGDALERAARSTGVEVDVVADAAVPAGEALLAGRWARADLTRGGGLGAVRAVLAAQSPDAAVTPDPAGSGVGEAPRA